MNYIKWTMLIFITWIFTAHGKVPVPIDEVFVPLGLKTTDPVRVLAKVTLPSMCYDLPEEPEIAYRGRDISISVMAKYRKDATCAQVVEEGFMEIDLGKLDAGKYDLIINPNSAFYMRETLKIRKDDEKATHTGYRVQDAMLSSDGEKITVSGYKMGDCPNQNSKSLYFNDQNTLTLRLGPEEQDPFCPKKPVEFSYDLDLKDFPIDQELYLYITHNNKAPFTKLIRLDETL